MRRLCTVLLLAAFAVGVGCTSGEGSSSTSPQGGLTDGGSSTSDAATTPTCPPGTDFTFDADNCGRCGRHCEDGECRTGTCTGTVLASNKTTPAFGGGYVLSTDRVFFFDGSGGPDSKGGAHVWSILKTGGEPKEETDVDVTTFQVLGDTILARLPDPPATPPASPATLLIVDRKSGAKKTIVTDPEKNQCLGTAFWRSNDEVITTCVLPERSFNGMQDAVIAVKPDGTMRTVYRANCSTCGLMKFTVADGWARWTSGDWGKAMVSFLRTDATDATMATKRVNDVFLGGSPSTPDGYRGTASMAMDEKYLVYQGCDLTCDGFGFDIALQDDDSYFSGEMRQRFDFAWAKNAYPLSFPTVLATDRRATFLSACRLPTMCSNPDDGKSLIILPWGAIEADDRGNPTMKALPYFARGEDAHTATAVSSDEKYVFWVESSTQTGATLWRAPL